MVHALDQIAATAQREAKTRGSGQSSMFDGAEDSDYSGGMSGIALTAPDVSDQEKAAWERELLGMTLSHNPLISLAALEIEGVSNSLDQLSEDTVGRQINILGYISSMVERTTREGKRFLIVNLEVLGGILEVMVWPDTLQRTTDVWRDGRLVMVTGKVRSRDDQISITCDSAMEFDPENPEPLPDPIPVKTWKSGKDNGDGFHRNGNGNKNDGRRTIDDNVTEKKVQMTTGTNIPTDPQKVVRLAVTESEDPSHDAHLLREVIGVLLEYPGRDRVNLDIRTSERLVRMDLPVVSTGYCDGLHSRLEELLGADTVTVHQELGLGIDPPAEESKTMPLEPSSVITATPVSENAPDEIELIAVARESEAFTGSDGAEMQAIAAETPKFEEPVAVAGETYAAPVEKASGDEPPF